MNSLWGNVRYAIRVFLKKPVLACVAVTVLALGIGASTAIFSVVSALLIRPLPYSEPDRLAVIWETWVQKGLSQIPVFIPDFLYWKDNSKAFESIAAFKNVDFNITGGVPERVSSARVSAGFFPTFGVSPLLGRTFLPEEDQHGGNKSVILSYGLWQRRYGSDRTIINKTITLNDVSYTVVGVMPPEFRFSIEWSMTGTQFPSVEMWVPLSLSPAESTSRSGHDLTVIGRLKRGVNWRQAQADMDMLADNLVHLQPEVNTGIGSNVVPLHSQSTSDIKSSLLILSGAVAFVLLIACANVANLQLAQSLTRRQEIAIRIALGAGRRHIIGQLLTESIMLAVVGGGLGVLLALWTTNSLIALSPTELGRGNKIVVDVWVISFTLIASFLAGIISGLAPAFIFSKPDFNESLKAGQGRTSTHAGFRRTSGLLVIWEVALALVLIVSAGLLIKSTSQLQKVDPGFNPQNLLTMKLSLPDTRYAEAGKQAVFFSQVVKYVEALPGVQSVAVSSNLPFEESWEILFTIEGRPEVSVRETPIASNHSVSPDYFRLMGIPLK
ncbi:MAG: ABC transporter permease [Blastocatellia bacterium]